MSDQAGQQPGRRFRLGMWDSEPRYLDDLYWARVLRAVHERAREVAVELVDLPSPDDPSDDAANDDVLLRLRSVGVDVVLDWPHAERLAATVLASGIPIVHLSETSLVHPLLIAPEGLEAVAFDLVSRAARAIGGRGTILAVGGGTLHAHSDDGASRLHGSQRAVASLPGIDLLHVPSYWDARAADQVARALRDDERPIDAIVGFSDWVASLARRCCVEAGRAPPNVPTFGINGTPDAIAEILAGTMSGTAEVLAHDLGRRAVDVAVAVAGRARYPRRFPYRFRYVDSALAPAVAARMLVDLGTVLRTPQAPIVRAGKAMDRVPVLMADANVPIVRSVVPDVHWAEVARTFTPMVGVPSDVSASTLVPLGTDFGARGAGDGLDRIGGCRPFDRRRPAGCVGRSGCGLARPSFQPACDVAVGWNRGRRRGCRRCVPGPLDARGIRLDQPLAGRGALWKGAVGRLRSSVAGGGAWRLAARGARGAAFGDHLPPPEVASWVAARLRAATGPPSERAFARVRATVARLHASFCDPLRRVQMARDAAVDADHLSRTFREVMGIPPRTYLVRLRVHHAMWLLRTTDLSVTDVGARVGWHDPAHFSSAFHRAMGRSPRAFRNEERSAAPNDGNAQIHPHLQQDITASFAYRRGDATRADRRTEVGFATMEAVYGAPSHRRAPARLHGRRWPHRLPPGSLSRLTTATGELGSSGGSDGPTLMLAPRFPRLC
jgi:AraC-like DNA-binding protein/ABC-type sugar transport system substrate-binding protein